MDGGWGRVERPDAEIWFWESDDDLPVIVLLHGLAGHAHEWDEVAATLTRHHRVVAVEQRAHGSSTRRPDDVTRAAFVADVVAVLDDLGVDRVPLVGHQTGAHTAMLVAAHHPERVERLVLVDGGLGGEDPEVTRALGDWLRSWPAPFADREAFVRFFGGERRVAEVWADGLEHRGDGWWPCWDADTLQSVLAHVHEREHVEEWAEVVAPTLLVRGEHGSVGARVVERMLAVRPDLEEVVVPGVGPDVHLEVPDTFASLLDGFLAGT